MKDRSDDPSHHERIDNLKSLSTEQQQLNYPVTIITNHIKKKINKKKPRKIRNKLPQGRYILPKVGVYLNA